MTDSVSLYIDVWGSYYRQILSPRWISSIERNCGDAFYSTYVVQNNIQADLINDCEDLTYGLQKDGISSVIRVDDLEKEALGRWGFRREDFDPIPYQSLGDLVAIDHCPSEYMVFFAGDALPWGESDWVREGIALLKSRPDILAVNPCWNGFYHHIRFDSVSETEDYFLGQVFSDQCYLARVSDLRANIYGETNASADEIHLKKHGNSFEKRLTAYMKNHDKFRASLKSACYITRP